uniref:Uncharacterized protein n=1 Tax=Piliocolobus tephrosceles TaxID=591936 RepID=A0A8C9GTY7_9PRIM
MDKNHAKQQVICKLSEKVTQDFTHPPDQSPLPANAAERNFLSQQEKIEHLKVGAFPPGNCKVIYLTKVIIKGFQKEVTNFIL